MKKWILISSLSLVVVLIGVILFLALYQKDFSYDFETPNIIEVNGNAATDNGTLKKQCIWDGLTNHSTKSIMYSAFNKDTVKKPSISTNSLKTFNSTADYVINLRYSTEGGEVLRIDGQTYKDPKNSAVEEVKFKELRIELSENYKDISLKIYVMDMTKTDKYAYVIEQFGDYTELYNYLSSIDGLKA